MWQSSVLHFHYNPCNFCNTCSAKLFILQYVAALQVNTAYHCRSRNGSTCSIRFWSINKNLCEWSNSKLQQWRSFCARLHIERRTLIEEKSCQILSCQQLSRIFYSQPDRETSKWFKTTCPMIHESLNATGFEWHSTTLPLKEIEELIGSAIHLTQAMRHNYPFSHNRSSGKLP